MTAGDRPVRSIGQRHGWRLFAGIALAGVVAHAALPTGGAVQAVVYDAVGIAAVAAIVAGIALHRPERAAPWVLFALGQLLFVVGDVLWSVVEWQTGAIPFPSIADVAYLAGYPFLALSMVASVRLRVRGGDRAGVLDGLILAAGASLVGWVWLVEPVLAGAGGLDPLALLVSVAYPLMDLLVIGVAFTFLATPGARTPSFVLLLASLGTILAADVVFAAQVAEDVYVDGGLLDAGWMLGYVLAGAAALHPSMRAVAAPHPVPVAWLGALRLGGLAAAMLAGPGVLLLQAMVSGAGLPALAIGSAVLGLLVLARLALVVRLLDEDVAARRRLEAELQFQATHDPLTGLANRRRFIERLDAALATPRDGALSILFIDLDDFKAVNDTLGHGMGDELLGVVAARIQASIRPGDLPARLGGDEFAVLLRDADVTVARDVAARLLASLEEPMRLDGQGIAIGASVGIAQAAPTRATAAALIRDADLAMYRAKAGGKRRCEVFESAEAPVVTPHPAPGVHRQMVRGLIANAEGNAAGG